MSTFHGCKNATLPCANFTHGEKTHATKFSTTTIAVSTTFVVILLLLTIFGNILVIMAFKLFRRMRQVTNYFVVSLAVTDILVAVFAMPVWVAYLITGPKWVFHRVLQMLWTCTDIMVGVASIWHLTFVSIDRYMCITNPMEYQTIMTSSRAIAIIISIWAYAITVAALGPSLWSWRGYSLFVTVLNFIIPAVAILIAYFKIFLAARHQAKLIELTVKGKSQRFFLRKELKATKTLAVVIGAFLVCWAPFFGVNLRYFIVNEAPSPVVVAIAKWAHYGNSCLNPLIYGVMNKDFRRAFKRILAPYIPAKVPEYSTAGSTNGRFSKQVDISDPDSDYSGPTQYLTQV